MPVKECLSSRIDELAREREDKQTISKGFHVLPRGCHWRMWLSLALGLLTSNDSIKKIPHRCA